jgi:hypothetical protein
VTGEFRASCRASRRPLSMTFSAFSGTAINLMDRGFSAGSYAPPLEMSVHVEDSCGQLSKRLYDPI